LNVGNIFVVFTLILGFDLTLLFLIFYQWIPHIHQALVDQI